MDLADRIFPAPLLLDFPSADEKSAVMRVADLLQSAPAVTDHSRLAAAIWERQCMQSPLLGGGIALPHARTSTVTDLVFALGRTSSPVPFGPDRQEVRLIFLYATPPHLIAPSLSVIAALVARLRNKDTLHTLLTATDEASFKAALR